MIDISALESAVINKGYSEEYAGGKENNTEDIYERLDKTFKDKTYLKNINGSNKNWLNIDNFEVFSKVINYNKSL